jgi:hypothetical protein
MHLPRAGLVLVALSGLAACQADSENGSGGGTHHDVSPAEEQDSGSAADAFVAQGDAGQVHYQPTPGDIVFEQDAGADAAPHPGNSGPDGAVGDPTDSAVPGDAGEPGADADTANPDGDAGVCISREKLDVLFVVDNSVSMTEEQATLVASLTKLVQQLTTGDLDGDGQSDMEPVTDLHLGVVSTDMGADGTPGVPSCGNNAAWGDDGRLISASRDPSCNGFALSGASYQAYVPGGTQTPDQLASDFGCLVSLGKDGCGFEQPLEAMYKALAPQAVKFAKGTKGHGDLENSGFLREDAKLVVIIVSDEDDCSITEQGIDLFIPSSTAPQVLLANGKPIGLNMRCVYREGAGDVSWAEERGLLQPVSRYIDGLKALKPGRPDAIVFGAIVGIPLAVDGDPLDEVLRYAGMQVTPDPSSSGLGDPASNLTTPIPACRRLDDSDTVVTSAAPGRRFVRTAQGFDNAIVRSICEVGFQPALNEIVRRVGTVAGGCR